MDLTCPKCHSSMRSYERNGVTVDQCTGCRGVFLDRGELERLVDQESAFYEQRREEPRREEPRREEPRYERRDRDDDDDRHRDHGYGGHGHGYGKHGYGKKRHKREGFLGELFDF
jgi:uncharacterized protein